MNTKKSIILATAIIIIVIMLMALLSQGCERDASIASRNISKEADQFRVKRRVIFYNAITDVVMFEMIGNLSINTNPQNKELEVTVKLGENQYRKHFLGLSDNVTYIVEQLDYSVVSKYRYELVFKPESLIPVSVGKE